MSAVTITRDHLIEAEKVRLFYTGLWLAGAGGVLLAVAIYWLNLGHPGAVSYLFLSTLLISGTLQVVVWGAWFYRSPSLLQVTAWQYYPLPLLLISAFAWGGLAVQGLGLHGELHGLMTLLSVAAGVLLTVMMLAAVEKSIALFLLVLMISVGYHLELAGGWPSPDLVILLLAFAVAMILAAAGFSVLSGIIARLRAGKQNVSGKLNLAKEKMQGLHLQLSDEDQRRRGVERQLYLAKVEAENANMAKSEFLATMSHEIRTPLNGIVPLLELLLQGNLESEQRQHINTALKSAHHLVSIINDILDFSKIEAGKLELELIDVELAELVDSVVAMLIKSAERRGLSLEYAIDSDVPARIVGDPIRLRQVLTNLVVNAIKFTSQGGVYIRVASRLTETGDAGLFFSVKDTGIGISEHVQPRLFAPFSQADASTTRRFGGTGLGLAICKQLVDLMGGRIGVHSTAGQGAEFWFQIPLHQDRDQQEDSSAGLRGLRLLQLCPAGSQQPFEHEFARWQVDHLRVESVNEALMHLRLACARGAAGAYQVLLVDEQEMGVRLASLLEGVAENRALAADLRIVILSDSPEVPDYDLEIELLPLSCDGETLADALLRGDSGPGCNAGSAPARAPASTVDSFMPMDIASVVLEESTAAEAQSSGSMQAQADRGSFAGRVLLVEDNLVNRQVMKGILDHLGLTCLAVADGSSALEAIRREAFDVVFMDCQMPQMDGYEATRLIRQFEQSTGRPPMPVVAVTANALPECHAQCLESGMDDYLAKPVMHEPLVQLLHKWLPATSGETTATENPIMPDRHARCSNLDDEGMTFEWLDPAVLEELSVYMQDELVDLLLVFNESSPILVREIVQAAAAGGWSRVRLSAHSLKSSAANVGANRLAGVARHVEQLSNEPNPTLPDDLTEQLQRACEKTVGELLCYCERAQLRCN